MRLTIIPSDKSVYVNEKFHNNLTWEGTPENVHALQWFETQGWIEFKDENPYDNIKPANENITELPQWALNAIDAWTIADTTTSDVIA